MPEQNRPRVSVYIATSVDGFISRPDGDVAWLDEGEPAPEGEDMGFTAFMDSVDALVMGRNTFEKVLEFNQWFYTKPVIVASKQLKEIPAHLQDKARIEALDPEALLAKLSAEGMRKLYLDGGLLIQSFLRAGLVDELIITQVPVLIGQGRRLFGEVPTDIWLKHQNTRAYPNGMVQTAYQVIHSPAPA